MAKDNKYDSLIKLLISNNNKNVENIIKSLCIKLDYLNSIKDLELKNEPNKLLITKHKKWEKEIKNLNIKIIETNKEIDSCISDLL